MSSYKEYKELYMRNISNPIEGILGIRCDYIGSNVFL